MSDIISFSKQPTTQSLKSFLEMNEIVLISETDYRNKDKVIERSLKEPVLIYEAKYLYRASRSDLTLIQTKQYSMGGGIVTCTGIATADTSYHSPISGNQAENVRLKSLNFGWSMSSDMNNLDGVSSVDVQAVVTDQDNPMRAVYSHFKTLSFPNHHRSGSGEINYSAPTVTIVSTSAGNYLGRASVFFDPHIYFNNQSTILDGATITVEWGSGFNCL